ncbi:MAG: AAA family ATPase, partial [Bacilli bacterium]
AETLFLSIANNFNLKNIEYIKDVIAWFNSLLIVFENNANSLDIYSLEGGKYHNQALEILKKADIGIKSFEVEKDKIANVLNPNDVLALNTQMQINPEKYMGQLKQEQENLYKIDLKTFFNVFDKNYNVVGQKEIKLIKDIGFNSEGTVRLLNYLGWILAALDKGRVILIDEIDSKLHFLVADYLINLFNSIDNNPKNSQLICTAHNIMLLDKDLRRDQIYLTCKDDFGVSKLTCLSDYKGVRKNDLFSKKYLAGFYSNLPYMGK